MTEQEAKDLAKEHVEWFLEIIKPLLISFMVHGIKHGEDGRHKRSGRR